ncbi:MAG: UDP-N-acetylmuramate dehydrogenase [Candidatus Krumholzibacteria bacterium]|nr:UDP-N-acetylmuramate dehydrogenase [Candidatus Krumholzibacteria bacterium]
MKSILIDTIRSNVRGEVLLSEPLKDHTTYRVGGAAELLVRPHSVAEAIWMYRLAHRRGIPLTILGAGSNVIAPDQGIEGIVIETKDSFKRITFVGNGVVRAEAGVTLLELARAAARKRLRGLEPISCIPGTAGGAVVMNAGTRDGDTSRSLVRAGVCTAQGRTRIFKARELSFGYRRSILLGSDWMVLWMEFKLTRGNPRDSLKAIDELWEERNRKYPLEVPSAGSVFKRPPNDFAGRIIESAGCKGMRVGGALVSERHANFIVNTGSATASDILALIELVRKTVYGKTGIYLELEQIPLAVHTSCNGSSRLK